LLLTRSHPFSLALDIVAELFDSPISITKHLVLLFAVFTFFDHRCLKEVRVKAHNLLLENPYITILFFDHFISLLFEVVIGFLLISNLLLKIYLLISQLFIPYNRLLLHVFTQVIVVYFLFH